VTEEVGALHQPTGDRLSVLHEVLRAQARHRRSWRAGLAALLLLAVFAALWLGPSSRAPGSGGLPRAAAPPAVVTAALRGIGQCLPAKPASHQVWWARVTNRTWSRLSHGGPPGDFPLYVAEISGDFACPSYFRGIFHTPLLTVTVPVNGARANPARFECGVDTGEIYPVRKLPGAQVFTLGRQQASSSAPRTC
jgi:hypothetical protein